MAAKRERLPGERSGVTHRFVIGEMKGYVTVNCYEDGRPGEIFFKMDHGDNGICGWADCWAMGISRQLQLGVAVEEVVQHHKGIRFEPSGITDNAKIRFALSPVDYLARWMEIRFRAND